jgi:hypothetical protein
VQILHNKKAITFLALLLIAATAVFAGGKVEERALEGSASVDLSNAEIIKIYPLNVLPNTLVAVEGEGFGSTPGVITVNGVTISTFVGWDDEAIHFRIPASAVADGALIEVGDSISEQELLEAPAGSVTVQFQVDTAKVAAATTTALRKIKWHDWLTTHPSSQHLYILKVSGTSLANTLVTVKQLGMVVLKSGWFKPKTWTFGSVKLL